MPQRDSGKCKIIEIIDHEPKDQTTLLKELQFKVIREGNIEYEYENYDNLKKDKALVEYVYKTGHRS